MKKNIISIILNLIVVISTTIFVYLGVTGGAGEGQLGLGMVGIGYFKAYTIDSNILGAISSILVIISNILVLKYNNNKLSYYSELIQYSASICLTLTFLVVTFFLAPSEVINGRSYFIMFSKDMFFFHLLNPILVSISFLILNNKNSFKFKEAIISTIPTIIYSIIYIVMVVIINKWEDFYNFTFGGRYMFIPIVLISIFTIIYVISKVYINIHNKNVKKL